MTMTDRPANPLSLKSHVALISGGLGDIGAAAALALAASGADVGIGDIRPSSDAVSMLQRLSDTGARATYHSVDVADADSVQGWLRAVDEELGVPSLIIVNAATVTVAGIRTLTPQQWSQELRINLDGAFHMAQAAAMRLLNAGKPGRIVFVGSWAGHVAHVHIPAYSVAKAGLRMLMKCMALELAPHDILVNEVAPGYVDAGLSARLWRANPPAREQATAHVPNGKLITAEEVAAQIAYLCEPENRHMTGATLLMDGGLSLVGPRNRKP